MIKKKPFPAGQTIASHFQNQPSFLNGRLPCAAGLQNGHLGWVREVTNLELS